MPWYKCPEFSRIGLSRGSKSRNKVAVDESAAGSFLIFYLV